jgi:hypothetical protein
MKTLFAVIAATLAGLAYAASAGAATFGPVNHGTMTEETPSSSNIVVGNQGGQVVAGIRVNLIGLTHVNTQQLRFATRTPTADASSPRNCSSRWPTPR